GGGGTWDTVLPPPASQASSSIFVPNNVTSITSVRLQGIAHTWIGDLQVILVDPNGAGHTLVCRHLFTGAGLGHAGDFVPGTNSPFTDIGASWPLAQGNVPSGTYVVYPGAWVSGNLGITNSNLASITGPAGTWTLQFYDWAAGDSGQLASWILDG